MLDDGPAYGVLWGELVQAELIHPEWQGVEYEEVPESVRKKFEAMTLKASKKYFFDLKTLRS